MPRRFSNGFKFIETATKREIARDFWEMASETGPFVENSTPFVNFSKN
jgi:hypothetical protein